MSKVDAFRDVATVHDSKGRAVVNSVKWVESEYIAEKIRQRKPDALLQAMADFDGKKFHMHSSATSKNDGAGYKHVTASERYKDHFTDGPPH